MITRFGEHFLLTRMEKLLSEQDLLAARTVANESLTSQGSGLETGIEQSASIPSVASRGAWLRSQRS